MTEKRFTIADYPTDIIDNQSGKKYPCSSYGTHMEIICDLLNEQHEQIERLKRNFRALDEVKCELADENEQLKSENETYKNMFLEIVESALTNTNCRELYCKGVLDIFDKANSLNQAREMIKAHLK